MLVPTPADFPGSRNNSKKEEDIFFLKKVFSNNFLLVHLQRRYSICLNTLCNNPGYLEWDYRARGSCGLRTRPRRCSGAGSSGKVTAWRSREPAQRRCWVPALFPSPEHHANRTRAHRRTWVTDQGEEGRHPPGAHHRHGTDCALWRGRGHTVS